MKRMAIALLLILGLFTAHIQADEAIQQPRIQIAVLLDTSGSMDGLIEQAKAQLWKIVNEFATTRKAGVRPLFEVALYEYGKDSIPAEEGYLRMILPLTDDLDRVSEELFALTTNGGSEYCGKVISSAVQGLSWSAANSDLKAIFIAGNEPFTQGPLDYKEACQSAISNGIMVNTIHCGTWQAGIDGMWKDGAERADGSYMNIDHNAAVAHIAAPQDDEIARLSGELNTTYLGYGNRGREAKMRQEAQDANAARVGGGSNVERAVSKASGMYKAKDWDLVDAVQDEGMELEEVAEEDLPEEMQGMTEEEKKEYLKEKAEKRKALQAKIRKLNEARKKYIAEKRKELAASGEDTLDAAMIKALRGQAEEKGFANE